MSAAVCRSLDRVFGRLVRALNHHVNRAPHAHHLLQFLRTLLAHGSIPCAAGARGGDATPSSVQKAGEWLYGYTVILERRRFSSSSCEVYPRDLGSVELT